MVQQLQLFECDPLHRNGNTALKVLLSRLSQGSLKMDNAKVYCKKIPPLSVHDIKDIVFEVKNSYISPDIVNLLFAIPCHDYQNIYQKSLANAWLNYSFDEIFTRPSITARLKACVTISQWRERRVIDVQEHIKSRVFNVILDADPDVADCLRNTPTLISLYLDILVTHQTNFSISSAQPFARPLNNIAEVLSERHCKDAKKFFEHHHLWDTVHCQDIYAQFCKIQKEKILKIITPTSPPAVARKI